MINLLFAGNDRIFDGLLTSAISITKHCLSPIGVYVLTMDLKEQNPAYIPVKEDKLLFLQNIYRAANSESFVKAIDCTILYKKYFGNSANSENSYTPYALIRLFADLIDDLPKKLLYLDTDILAARDIGELYDLDVNDFELAAAKDYYGRFFINKNYINSGVLLLNMEKIRNNNTFEKCRKLCAKQKMMFPDQTAINKSASHIKYLPMRFNEQHKDKPDTVIRHFSKVIKWLPYFHTRNIKPWHTELVNKKLKLYRYDDVLDEFKRKKDEFYTLSVAAATEND